VPGPERLESGIPPGSTPATARPGWAILPVQVMKILGLDWSSRRWRIALLGLGAALLFFLARAALGPQVPTHLVARRDLVQRVVASGRVLPPSRIQMGSLFVGQAAKVLVREGDRVQEGQLLVQLDDADARAALAQARAAAAQARARLEQVRLVATRTSAEALRQARLRVEQAETKLRRTEAMARAGSVAQAELDDAQKALELARSQEESAAVQARSAAEGSDLRAVQAALAQAQATERAAETRLAQTQLRAPGPGVVIERRVEPGDVVTAGRALLVLARDGETEISVQPDEKNLATLRVGQEAAVVADAYPDRPFPARVTYLAPAVDPARGTVEVKLAVADPPPFLRTDMTVSVNVDVARRSGVLVLPADCVRDAGGQPWVLAVTSGRAVRRPVRLGVRGADVVQIAEGLAEGDAVVAPAAGPVVEGRRVRSRPLPALGMADAL